MSSVASSIAACRFCLKTQNQLPNPLKRCAKCKGQWYCGRECQKSDWKNHKKVCGTASRDTENIDTTNNATAPPRRNKVAICTIPDPFTALNEGKWLYNRPKNDVFKLLVDTYRMRLEDEYVFQGEVDEDSLYGGAGARSALRHFKSFMNKVIKLDGRRSRKLLPDWWSKDSLKELLDFASTDEFSNVGYAAEKHDIQDHYGQSDMPMQLRMFSEKLDGTLAAGMSGESMLQMRMALENKGVEVAHFSL